MIQRWLILLQFKVEGKEKEELDIKQLTDHLGEGINGKCRFKSFVFCKTIRTFLWSFKKLLS